MKIINLSSGEIITSHLEPAFTFFRRLYGLMFRRSIPEDYGLWIKPCNSIHMFFMSFPIDVVFLDENLTVVHFIQNIKPWKISPIVKNAKSVIELPAGTIAKKKISLGNQFHFE